MGKILLTGSTGLIGSEVLKLLLEKYQVFAISKNLNVNFKHPNLSIINMDLSKLIDPSKLPDKIDSIIHLAQSNYYKNYPDRALGIFNVNVFSTMQLLEYARTRKVKRFIFASTGSVYSLKKEKCKEEDNLSNIGLGFYPITKLQSEFLLGNYSQFFTTIILRYFFVYGPNQKKTMLIPNLINRVSSNEKITLSGENGLWFNPIFVEDAAIATIKALNLNQSNIFNIAGDEILSLRSICDEISSLLKQKVTYDININQKEQSLIADNNKMRKLLLIPKYPFQKGLRKVLE